MNCQKSSASAVRDESARALDFLWDLARIPREEDIAIDEAEFIYTLAVRRCHDRGGSDTGDIGTSNVDADVGRSTAPL